MFSIAVIFTCVILTIFIRFIFHVRKQYNFWNEKGVPSTKPIFFFGHLKDFIFGKRHLAFILDDAYKAFPDARYVGIYDILKPNLIIKDPELVGNILIKDFSHFHDRVPASSNSHRLNHHIARLPGKSWNLIRSKLNPTFSTIKLKSMFDLMESFSDTLDSYVKDYVTSNKFIDAKEVMGKYTTDVIGNCIFGLEFDALKDMNSKYWDISQKVFAITPKSIAWTILRSVNPILLKWFKISEITDDVDEFFFKLLQQIELFRKNGIVQRNDLMQLMISLRDQEISETNDSENKEILFSDNIIASNMYIFYSAGFDTPSTTLSYCLYDLALHPEIQERVRAEIMKVLEANNGILTYDSLNDLVYTEMVLSETLRIHNPGSSFRRLCTKTYPIPNSSLVLKPGDRLTIPVYSIHHDEKNFPNPSKFDPERFSEENKKKIKPYTYLAFGDGPRICIANKFAMMEMKICLKTLLKKYKFSPCSKTEIPLEINPRATQAQFPPKNGVWLKVSEI